MKTAKSTAFSRQRGLTLVELMVALVLGLLMTIAVVQTFLTTKQTYNVTNGVSRIQENARFGHHFITKDLREAGNNSCVTQVRNMLTVHPPTNFLPFQRAITGWEYAGTSMGDTYTIPSTMTTPTSGWSGDGPVPAFLLGDLLAGSDVIAVRSLIEMDLPLDPTNNVSSSSLSTNLSRHGIDDDTILMVGNCHRVDLFHHRSQGSGSQSALNASSSNRAVPGNDNLGSNVWSAGHGPTSKFFVTQTTLYFVQEGANGFPSLFRMRTTRTPLVEENKEELVEGVESMQVYYGEDTNGDNNPNRYVSADLVGDWSDVVSARIGLLFQSTTKVSEFDQATNYTLLDNITITHAVDDAILRYAVNSTVKMRNRGLASEMSHDMVCDANDSGCLPLGG